MLGDVNPSEKRVVMARFDPFQNAAINSTGRVNRKTGIRLQQRNAVMRRLVIRMRSLHLKSHQRAKRRRHALLENAAFAAAKTLELIEWKINPSHVFVFLHVA